MKIRMKNFFLISLSIVMVMFIAVIIQKLLITQYLENEEINTIHQNYRRAVRVIEKEANTLKNTTLDWAYWDDTYNFINNRNKDYIDTNLQDSTLQSLELNFMYFFDAAWNAVVKMEYGLDAVMKSAFDTEFLKKLDMQSFLTSGEIRKNPLHGIVMIAENPAMLCISSIKTSDGKSEAQGYLVMGRFIDQAFTDYLEEVLEMKTGFVGIRNDLNNEARFRDYQETTMGSQTIMIKRDDIFIQSYAVLSDIHHKPDIYMTFEMKRQAFIDGHNTLLYSRTIMYVSLLFLVVICILLIDRFTIKPLKTLHKFVETVGNQRNTEARISLKGNDEISQLADVTNTMLENIGTSYEEMELLQERFRLILEATNDGYFDMDMKTKDVTVGSEWLKSIGYDTSNSCINFREYIRMIHPMDRKNFLHAFNQCRRGKIDRMKVEHRILLKTGEWVWIDVRGKVIESDETKLPVRILGTISNINNQKKYEQENIYLSQTDRVTELKNRAYAETLIQADNNGEGAYQWIIIGDIDGLKPFNDQFGHQEGDRLLHTVGGILKKCCSHDNIPARWGGDEFVIFVKEKSAEKVEKLIELIHKECALITDFPVPISITMGCAQKDQKHTDMNDVLKLAEERMCRSKLVQSRSSRSAILVSLEQSLHEKHIETEEHTKRISQTCILIGTEMGLSRDELDELALLGVLHDIGKIEIQESILLKPGKLTSDEWEIMKKHTEIGYRIAESTPELAHIADKILTHHERYNGTGYPRGLKGEEIPKLARLLTIVDSFDVMTHDRIYKKAMSMEEAVQELKNCSGTQFDPYMTQQFLKLLNNVTVPTDVVQTPCLDVAHEV